MHASYRCSCPPPAIQKTISRVSSCFARNNCARLCTPHGCRNRPPRALRRNELSVHLKRQSGLAPNRNATVSAALIWETANATSRPILNEHATVRSRTARQSFGRNRHNYFPEFPKSRDEFRLLRAYQIIEETFVARLATMRYCRVAANGTLTDEKTDPSSNPRGTSPPQTTGTAESGVTGNTIYGQC